MAYVDPFAEKSKQQYHVRRDTHVMTLSIADMIRVSQLAVGGSGGRCVAWRYPESFITTAGGDTKYDTRGDLMKVLGFKVTFQNLLNAPLRVKASVPLGMVDDPKSVYVRAMVSDLQISEAGSTKVRTRVKGKGKNKVAKEYSSATDRVSLDFVTNRVFRDSASEYRLHQVDVPGDSIDPDVSTYTAAAFDLVNYIPIIVNEFNQYANAKYAPETGALKITVVVRYTSYQMSGTQAVDAFYCGSLRQDDVYTVTPRSYLKNRKLSNSLRASPVVEQWPDEGYDQLMLTAEKLSGDQPVYLAYGNNGKVVGPARWASQETNSNVRVTIPAMLASTVYVDETDRTLTSAGSLEFAFDDATRRWYLRDYYDNNIILHNVGQTQLGRTAVCIGTPVILFDRRKVSDLAVQPLQLSITWSMIARGLTTVVKTLQAIQRVGDFLFGG